MFIAHLLHFFGVVYFLGFLFLDALVIRSFLDFECHSKKLIFHKKAKNSLSFCAFVIVATGLWMLWEVGFSPPPHIWIKILLALTALLLFFTAPYSAKKLSKAALAYLYAFISLLTIVAVLLAKA